MSTLSDCRYWTWVDLDCEVDLIKSFPESAHISLKLPSVPWYVVRIYSSLSNKYVGWNNCTGKSLSEAFILTSTNPQYDKILFIDLPVQYMKTTSSEHVVYINCSECQNKKQFVCTTCSPHVLSL